MSHLHLTDGVIAPVWCILGYVLAAIALTGCIVRVRGSEVVKRAPFIGLIAALMLLTMSVPLGFIPFHLNLTVLLSIIAGPAVGFIAMFAVNFILALIGHGGITVVGINTLIIGIEVFLGYGLFRLFVKVISMRLSALLAVVCALLVSTSAMVGVVYATNAGMASALPHQHESVEQIESHERELEGEHVHGESFETVLSEVKVFSFTGIAAVVLILLMGIGLEAAVTFFVVGFFQKVRPDFLIQTRNLHR